MSSAKVTPIRRKSKAPRSFRVAGLFAGIGGLELGLSRAGHRTTQLCEVDSGASAVLRARFPKVPLHDDVRTLARLPSGTDLLVAGFPCQDLSQAGATRGIAGARSGLVGEVFRLVRNQRVPWVVLENVPFMLQLARGEAMEVIVAALEELGYRWAYRVVDSRAFGVPQRRERVVLVGSLDDDPRRVLFADEAGAAVEPASLEGLAKGFYWTEGVRGLGWAIDAVPTLKGGSTIGIPSPPAILMPDGAVVKPDLRDAERLQGFEAGWTAPAESVGRATHRWKLVGNAVTVDMAAWLGERLAQPGDVIDLPSRPFVRKAAWPRAAWNIGDGIHTADFSSWPIRAALPHLAEFLQFTPEPLSERATAGFLKRANSPECTLRFPGGFIEALERHLRRHTRRAA